MRRRDALSGACSNSCRAIPRSLLLLLLPVLSLLSVLGAKRRRVQVAVARILGGRAPRCAVTPPRRKARGLARNVHDCVVVALGGKERHEGRGAMPRVQQPRILHAHNVQGTIEPVRVAELAPQQLARHSLRRILSAFAARCHRILTADTAPFFFLLGIGKPVPRHAFGDVRRRWQLTVAAAAAVADAALVAAAAADTGTCGDARRTWRAKNGLRRRWLHCSINAGTGTVAAAGICHHGASTGTLHRRASFCQSPLLDEKAPSGHTSRIRDLGTRGCSHTRVGLLDGAGSGVGGTAGGLLVPP